MPQSNKALMRRFYAQVANKGRLELIDLLVAPNFVEHETFPGLDPGREGVHQFFAMMRSAFPDLHFAVDDLIAEGTKVAARLTITGTHRGEFAGIKPTGNKISVRTLDVIRFRNGKAIEHWGVTDELTMMRQLGVIPPQ